MAEPENTNGDNLSSRKRWPLIYSAVVATAVLVIFLIYVFSRHYGD